MLDAVARLTAALEGRYTIERELGRGGMATVYLADDLKHERKVALKVLKPELAAVVGAERFLVEIKTTANLTHPHILPLFDSGEADSFLFYVMPHIDGESLRDRIDREKQLNVDDAVAITWKVADALDYAHEHGVVHRDIKPGNILLSERGEPLIADFGIALAVAQAGGGRITETGLSLGTPHYMSPEQATGDRDADPRSDVYALGCVLYEMLAGQPPFSATTAQAVLVKVLTMDAPAITSERRTVPLHVGHALAKTLEKLPADRFTSAAEFARALRNESFRYRAQTSVIATPVAQLPGERTRPWNRLTIAMTTLAAVLTLTLGWLLLRPASPRPVTRVSVHIPEDQIFDPSRGDLDLSADGSLIVYRGVGDDGQRQLWVRPWNVLNATPIRGTSGGFQPAISPDGQEVAFLTDGSIRVVPLQGGVSRTLAEARGICCAGWSSDGAWVYYSEPTVGLRRVPAGGGSPEIVTEVDAAGGDQINVLPDVLPDGRGVVFATLGRDGSRIKAADFETGAVKDLTQGTHPRYSHTGHLLFIDATTLLAAPFDVESLELTGAAMPVAEGVAVLTSGLGFFAVSETGTLVYRTDAGVSASGTPVWVERDGTAREIDPGWTVSTDAFSSSLALSPNGDRLAISIENPEGVADVWVKQLDTGPLSRLTFEGGNIRARWSPDGQSLTFLSNRAENLDVWTKRADGSDTAELVLDREALLQEAVYSPDGTWLVFREGVNQDADIYAVRLPIDSAVVPLEVTEFQERAFSLSPDGRWLAFVSNRSGSLEVFVRPFPEAGQSLQQVSTNGGREPLWAHSGRELFYMNGVNELVAVQVSTDPAFVLGQQEVLFSAAGYIRNNAYITYDVASDDQRFVMLRIGDSENAVVSELILVENWAEELRQRVGN
jgi:serine/threonine-protein kinase